MIFFNEFLVQISNVTLNNLSLNSCGPLCLNLKKINYIVNWNLLIITILKLPKMNAFPGPCSVLVLDNVSIHKGQYLLDICSAKGIQIEFLPPYSPDLNPVCDILIFQKMNLQHLY